MSAHTDNDFLITVSDVLVPLGQGTFAHLSPAEQVFVLVWGLEADVNNGGFNQYFFNSYSDHAAAVPHALRAIGAIEAAAIVERALAFFPDGPPADRRRRQQLLESLDPNTEAFNALDDEFFAYPDDLTALLAQFVRANRASVRGA
jgi:hypothetical protein